MKHVIVGAGAAGVTAANTIREQKPYDDIVLISSDKVLHSRCMLYKYLRRERSLEELSFVPSNFFNKNNIEWKKGQTVETIDIRNKQVVTDETTVAYDKLLIATGAKSLIPETGEYKTADNVFTFRSLEDAFKLEEAIKDVNRIAIIGAGLVGLNVAYGLLGYGKEIVFVEQATRLMPLQLDYRSAYTYQKEYEKNGCEFYFNSIITDTIVGVDNKIIGLRLHDRNVVPCDMVIITQGIEPQMDFFLSIDEIKKDRNRVLVNSSLQTSISDIYAAGDVTRLSGVWPNAKKQGYVAGMNMAGGKEEYTDFFAFKNNMNFFNIITLSVGEVIEKEGDKVYIKEDRKSYKKIVVRNGRIVTVIFQGDVSNVGIWQYLVKNEIDISSINKSIWDISFVDYFDINDKGEYLWKYEQDNFY